MKNKNHWVVGFLFRKNGSEIALVSKTHPGWQAGKLNGVGGHIEEGEEPIEAMRREFLEEAGVAVTGWREFALLHVQDGDVHFFVTQGDHVLSSMTEEVVGWHDVSKLHKFPMIKNLEWLIPLALDPGNKHTIISYFQTYE